MAAKPFFGCSSPGTANAIRRAAFWESRAARPATNRNCLPTKNQSVSQRKRAPLVCRIEPAAIQSARRGGGRTRDPERSKSLAPRRPEMAGHRPARRIFNLISRTRHSNRHSPMRKEVVATGEALQLVRAGREGWATPPRSVLGRNSPRAPSQAQHLPPLLRPCAQARSWLRPAARAALDAGAAALPADDGRLDDSAPRPPRLGLGAAPPSKAQVRGKADGGSFLL